MTKPHSSSKDQLLLNRITKGDEIAFEELYQAYSVPIYNYLIRLTHEQAVAENLLQETFLAIWEGAKKFRGEAQVKNCVYCISSHLMSARDVW